MNLESVDLTLSGLQHHYRQRDFTPRMLFTALLEALHQESTQPDNNPVWITLLSMAQIDAWLQRLEQYGSDELPLYGVPFAIKDNIDLAGIPTTAACPDFTCVPAESAATVELLLQAGAIPVGKTNMDQFATGLVGTRSPYGVCRNALNPAYIAGGSSSGSAVAVASHKVSFSLGTDTAGSGRIPAALNNIAGLKPTRGLLSTRGVVPACQSLDCVSVFAHNVEDLNAVLDVTGQPDQADPWSRTNPFNNGPLFYGEPMARVRVGVPQPEQLAFFGDRATEALFNQAVDQVRQVADIVEIDFSAMRQAAALLYEGPWVAERFLVIKDLLQRSPESVWPVTRNIITPGGDLSAQSAFAAFHQLQSLKRQADQVLQSVDCVMTPTYGRAYSLEDVAGEPLTCNSKLGYYTNFMNLLDFAAVALPSGTHPVGVGFGLTLFHSAFRDRFLLSFAGRLQNHFRQQQGTRYPFKATGQAHLKHGNTVDVVVCGAHMAGLPLNWQLTMRGATRIATAVTATHYRLYALAGPVNAVARPGLVRTATAAPDAISIDVEVWRMPLENFGSFVEGIPSPLGMGKVELEDGRWLPGFICEAQGIDGATDISVYRSWRRYLTTVDTL